MKIKIECDCGETYEVNPSDVYVRDTTPCSCGSCRGERYEVNLGSCPRCNKDNEVEV
jgi:hypothetical protein